MCTENIELWIVSCYLWSARRCFIILKRFGEYSIVVDDWVQGRVEIDHDKSCDGCDVNVSGVSVRFRKNKPFRSKYTCL